MKSTHLQSLTTGRLGVRLRLLGGLLSTLSCTLSLAPSFLVLARKGVLLLTRLRGKGFHRRRTVCCRLLSMY